MVNPTIGLQFIRQDDLPVPVIGANLDVVGIVGPCSTANTETFPENEPVLVYSNDTATLAQLGTDGYIPDAINAINAQLANQQVAVQMVIVTTPYGTNSNANIKLQQTIANIMGNSIERTGVWALMLAPNLLYCTPRLITAPGYTGQMANSLDTLEIGTIGEGYTPGQTYQISFAPGNGETNGATLVLPMAHAVADSNGTINNDQLFIDSYGAWMTVAPTATLPVADGPPFNGTDAAGQILFSQTPGVGSTLALNGRTITFVSGSPSGNQVQIDSGDSLANTLANLLTFLTGATGDTDLNVANYVVNNGTLTITYKTVGTAGNAYAIGGTVSGATFSSTTLTGGQNAVSAQDGTLTATIALGANPVVSALAGGLLDGLMGHAIVESAGTSQIADENWRDTIAAQRIIPMSGGVKTLDANGDIVVMPIAPRIIGAIVATDFNYGGYPFHSACNTPIEGIVGPARTIEFSLTDPSTEGQQLLAANIGILVRGEIGVETAISSGGFVYLGTDTCATDPLWQFYNVSRGRDFIELSLMPMMRTYLGHDNIDAQTVTSLLGSISDFLSRLKSTNNIYGYNVGFQGSLNSAADIRAGQLTISFAAEEPDPLRLITTYSQRYAPAIDAMVAQLQAQLNVSSVGVTQAAA